MPASFADQGFFGRSREVPACADQESAAAHREVEHLQAKDLVGGAAAGQRLQRLPNEISGNRARRVERASGFSNVPRAIETGVMRLVLEDVFVDGSELL